MKIAIHELKNHISGYLRRISSGNTSEPTGDIFIERLTSLPWVRWSGGKPQLRPGIAVQQGDKTIAESLLTDRR